MTGEHGLGLEDDDEIGPTRRVKRIVPAKPASPAAAAAPAPKTEARKGYHPELIDARKACIDAGGEVFGKYVLLGEVGKGGMAEVRLAVEMNDAGPARLCVIKRSKGQGSERAVLDEGRIMTRLDHPNIVRLFASGTIEGRAFLSFELVDGLSLRQVFRFLLDEPLSIPNAVEIGAQAAAALAYVHSAQDSRGAPLKVVHRDVSPENVLISREGRVRLVDFGIARYSDRGEQTKMGTVKGKLGYLAPEQMGGPPERIGPHTDVFALGLVIAEAALGGKRVFPPKMLVARDAPAVVRERIDESSNPFPEALAELLTAMTDHEISRRPSARAVSAQLAGLAGELDPGPALAEVARDRLFRKLLPLDLDTVLELPTKRVAKLGPSEEGEAASAPEPQYSGTMELLFGVRWRGGITPK